MYKVAITGGVASGKTAIGDILRKQGLIVLSSDEINNTLLQDASYLSRLAELFPKLVNGIVVDRRAIRDIISIDSNMRAKLNNLAHTEIADRIRIGFEKCPDKIGFCEVPLLFESGMEDMFDLSWLVISDKSVRLERLMSRDSMTHEQGEAMISCQMPDDEKIKLADLVIYNDGEIDKLTLLVIDAYNKILYKL